MRRRGQLPGLARNRLAVLALLVAVLTGCGQGQLPQGPLGMEKALSAFAIACCDRIDPQ